VCQRQGIETYDVKQSQTLQNFLDFLQQTKEFQQVSIKDAAKDRYLCATGYFAKDVEHKLNLTFGELIKAGEIQ